MKILLTLVLILISVVPNAQAADTIDREYQAFLSAQRKLAASAGCTGFSASLVKGYTVGEPTVYGADKKPAVVIQGYAIRVVCTATGSQVPVEFGVSLKWDAPTTRVDGTPLAASEIKGYELYRMASEDPEAPAAKLADLSSVLGYEMTGLTAGVYHYRLKTVGTDDLKSPFSPAFSITLQ